MHYAVHGHTTAELIVDRADAQKEHMGLTTWEKAPDGKIVKPDVSVAKNYLKENELEAMGHIVNSFLDIAEDMAKRHIPMTMEDWAKRIDKFLDVTDRPILADAGKVRLNTPKNLPKLNLKNTASFKTVCSSPTSTKWMTKICPHLILRRITHNQVIRKSQLLLKKLSDAVFVII